ncbi:phosphotransferase family protein [Tenggerimyces flavus]|uniref:Phosphotransferase family protein n=1 Tax=Tenggerimyces flavus TaxID=1708749 RepID=A0ABV7Y4I5_9ACTN|nr:aminoglycoside phosphotransferase family protein [Tenggerimyces flavus]MBM7788496.1 aminoglycoside phosphotransferase (APT) family kinase protein [Tenggerimyces flavus]
MTLAAALRSGEVIGSGMEGTVIALGPDLVAKVWHRRSAAELSTLQRFYTAVGAAGLPFATPSIHSIAEVDGKWATIEARLPGVPLTHDPTPAAVSAVTSVLAALAAVSPTPEMGVLPILEGETPFGTEPFAYSLARLVERRVARFHKPLTAAVPDLDALTASCIAHLEALPEPQPALVHGDLIPMNIHVDTAGNPVAVLDFGFLTAVGDPAFDAAITASIFDMYGPQAANTEATLDKALDVPDPHRRAIYRAAYALATANSFSPSGKDGHFAWCVEMLKRNEIQAALAAH